jgi:hypothetical protein
MGIKFDDATLDPDGNVPDSNLPDSVKSNIFEVADIPARDALPIGQGDGEVWSGDIVSVDDADGEGNRISYKYFDGVGYVILSRGENGYNTFSVPNGNATVVANGDAVGLEAGTTYRQYTDPDFIFAGVNVGGDANNGDEIHLVAEGIVEVNISSPVPGPGTPLRLAQDGSFITRVPGENVDFVFGPGYDTDGTVVPVVGFLLKDLGGGRAFIRLVKPFTPNRVPMEIYVEAPMNGSTDNILRDRRASGRLFWRGKPSYLISAQAKLQVPGGGALFLDTFNGQAAATAETPYIFINYLLPSAVADEYGDPQNVYEGDPRSPGTWTYEDSALFVENDEIVLTQEFGSIDGEDLTVLLMFEEKAELR